MIPEIDGTSRDQVQKFLNASTYNERNPADKRFLIRAILCTKLTGKAMSKQYSVFCSTEVRNRNVLLIKMWHRAYTARFNMIRQKSGESARKYGLRLDKLAMEFYQSMTEGKEQLVRATESDTRYYPRINIGKFPARTPRHTNNSAIA